MTNKKAFQSKAQRPTCQQIRRRGEGFPKWTSLNRSRGSGAKGGGVAKWKSFEQVQTYHMGPHPHP